MGIKGNAIENREQYGDSIDRVQFCLDCPYVECTNCLDSISNDVPLPERSEYGVASPNYKAPLNKNDKAVILYYATAEKDQDIADILGKATNAVSLSRKKLGLPPMRTLSKEKRKELVEPWMSMI